MMNKHSERRSQQQSCVSSLGLKSLLTWVPALLSPLLVTAQIAKDDLEELRAFCNE